MTRRRSDTPHMYYVDLLQPGGKTLWQCTLSVECSHGRSFKGKFRDARYAGDEVNTYEKRKK
jgi:hypothetical protein